jgi:hypothetical protein
LLLFGIGIMGTAGPAPGSLEGIIYTKLTFSEHLIGLPEVMLQTLLFSVLLFKWTQYRRQYLTTLSIMAVLLIILMSVLGVMDSKGILNY